MTENTTRRCSICAAYKPLSEYYNSRHGTPGWYCKGCHREVGLEWKRRRRAGLPTEGAIAVVRDRRGTAAARINATRYPGDDGRLCSKCRQTVSRHDFYKAKTMRDGLTPWCKACVRATEKAKRKKSPAKLRLAKIRYSYGITGDQYQAMIVGQGGVCAICAGAELVQKNLSVDHDHVTGGVRGLLCGKCNSGLGFFRDNQAFLRSAADYLDRFAVAA